jgi:hypothetical protein
VKIAVPLVIELTPEQIADLAVEYGIDTDPASVREFVRSYVLNIAQQSAASEFWSARLR